MNDKQRALFFLGCSLTVAGLIVVGYLIGKVFING